MEILLDVAFYAIVSAIAYSLLNDDPGGGKRSRGMVPA
jgi:hypothetical protein